MDKRHLVSSSGSGDEGGAMGRKKERGKPSMMAKFASIAASAILVFNLIPTQALAEIRDEVITLVSSSDESVVVSEDSGSSIQVVDETENSDRGG